MQGHILSYLTLVVKGKYASHCGDFCDVKTLVFQEFGQADRLRGTEPSTDRLIFQPIPTHSNPFQLTPTYALGSHNP